MREACPIVHQVCTGDAIATPPPIRIRFTRAMAHPRRYPLPRRGDPNTGARGRGDMSDWPRNGALLRGVKHDVNGTPWLEVGARAPAIRFARETVASSSRRVL